MPLRERISLKRLQSRDLGRSAVKYALLTCRPLEPP